MAATEDLRVPATGATRDLPIPATAVDPRAADVESFQSTAGEVRKGLRAGMNQIGSSALALAANLGEVAGLTDFAASRFEEAKDMATFADVTGPRVRDYRAVKDLTDAVNFVSGLGGQAVGSTLPAVVLGGAGGARFGLRGAMGGAALGSFVPEAGEQALRIADAPATASERLANAAGKGAVNAALDVASPGGAYAGIRRVAQAGLRGSTEKIGRAAAKGVAGEAVTEAAQEAVGQEFHTAIEPGRDASDDTAALINAAIGGAVGGGVIAGGSATAAKVPGALRDAYARMVPQRVNAPIADRPQTAQDVEDTLGTLRRPEDPNDFSGAADVDPDKLPDWLDLRDNEIARTAVQWFDRVKDQPWAKKFKDVATDPDQRDAFVAELRDRVKRAVDHPATRKAAGDFKEFVASATTAAKAAKDEASKPSLQRTAVDLAVYDNMLKHMDPEKLEALSAKERLQLGGDLKSYVLNFFGRREANPEHDPSGTEQMAQAGALGKLWMPERAKNSPTRRAQMPHALMDMFGDRLEPLLSSTSELLRGFGQPVQKADFKRGVSRAEKSRTAQQTKLEELVRTNLRDEWLADPATREEAVRGATQQLTRLVHEGPRDWKKFDSMMQRLFGNRADAVLDAFDAERENITRGYEHFVDEQEDDGDMSPEGVAKRLKESGRFRVSLDEIEGTTDTKPDDQVVEDEDSLAQRNSPYRDKRLGVPMAMRDAEETLRALRSEYDPQVVAFRGRPHVQDNKMTGKVILEAEDRESKSGFTDEEYERIKDKYGKSGLENNVITVSRQDEGDPSKRKLIKVSLPNLVAETARTFRWQGKKDERYVHALVMEGMSRLMGDPRMTGFSEKTAGQLGAKNEGWDIPDDTTVAVFRDGRAFTWGEVKGRGLSRRELLMQRLTSDAVAEVREAEGMDQIRAIYKWMQRNERLARGDDDRGAADRIRSAMDQVEEEAARREREGDKPARELSGVVDTEELRLAENRRAESRPRRYQEETGLPLHDAPRREPFVATTGGPVKVTRPDKEDRKAADMAKVTPEDRKASRADAEVQKVNEAIVSGGGAYQVLLNAVRGTAQGAMNPHELDVLHRQLTGGKVTNYLVDIQREAHKKLAMERYDALVKAVELAINKAKPAPKGKPKFSEMRLGPTPMDEQTQAEIRAYAERVLGKSVDVAFPERIEGDKAGLFKKVGPAERLLISTFALDPKSVGYHEASHALFSRLKTLNPKAYSTLMAAAGSPNVTAQLRKLLEGEPAALRQLSDPEERAAYMYQFWAARDKDGKPLLEVGPKATSVFQSLRNWLRGLLDIWTELSDSSLPKAEQLLEAFHSGRLAQRSAAGRVIDEILPKTDGQLSHKIGDMAAKVFFTADGYVRGMNIPAFTERANKFLSPSEQQGTPSGFMQVKHVKRNELMNRYVAATRGLTADDLGKVLKALQTNSRPESRGLQASHAAIRRLLDDVFEYAQGKGVKGVVWDDVLQEYTEEDLRHVKDYFPRAYDRELIQKDWSGFIRLLEKHGVKNPGEVAEKLVGGRKADPNETDWTAGLTYYAPGTLKRVLDIPAAELEPYLRKDLGGIMYAYIGHMVRRAEYAERFGNQGQDIAAAIEEAKAQGATPSQVQSFSQYVQAMEGSLGNEIDPKLKGFFGAVLTYQNLRLLPLALFSSLVDPAGIAVRGGTMSDALSAFTRGVRELVSDSEDGQREFARTVGAINEATDEQMMADAYGSNFTEGWQRWMNNKLFKWNGMESWNNSMRIAAASAAERFIIRQVQSPTEHSARWLAEINLLPEDVRVQPNGRLELTPTVVDAINKWVDGAVLRPHAGIRPIWMSDPHFMLISHLKQFTYSFQKAIVARSVHEAKHGNVTPLLALTSYVPLIIAADIMRAVVTPGGSDDDRLEKWDMVDWMQHGVARAGITGPGQYVLDAGRDLSHSGYGVESVLGPSAEQLLNFLRAAAGAPGSDLSREALRAIPPVPALNMRG